MINPGGLLSTDEDDDDVIQSFLPAQEFSFYKWETEQKDLFKKMNMTSWAAA